MSGEGSLFLDACGGIGPLRLEWSERESIVTQDQTYDKPSVLVGRSQAADLRLLHPSVGKRHAYFQMIEGRLYAIDLDSREGLRWAGVPRRSGWIDRQRPVQIGSTLIRLIEGDRDAGDEPGAGPLSRRFVSRHSLPGVVLDILGGDGATRRWAMDRPLVLVGRSSKCKVRLNDPETSLFACALIRTPRGVWMNDLLSSRGVMVNGVPCRQSKLEDGDTLGIGDRLIRLSYNGLTTQTKPRSLPQPLPPGEIPLESALALPQSGSSLASANLNQSAWELIPELVLRQLQGRDALEPATSGPLDQALMLLVRLLGDIHRDQLGVLREELEQIRRINHEMTTLKDELTNANRPAIKATGTVPSLAPIDAPPTLEPLAAHDRPAPLLVHDRVTERIEAWHNERQSRWRRVLGLLIKP